MPEAVATLFGTDGSGTLRVLSAHGSLRVTSRNCNDAGAGSWDQGIPAGGPGAPGSRVLAYGSIVDRRTGDPTYVAMR